MKAPVEYEQTDKRWASIMYSNHGDRSQTIGASACGPTCAAMVAATLHDPAITPKEAAAWSTSHGHRTYNSGTAWAFFKAYLGSLGIKVRETGSAAEAVAALRLGRMVITSAAKGIWTNSGHFILAYGLQGNKVMIHDPNSEKAYRELADLATYKAQTVRYWIIDEDWQKEDEDVTVKAIQVLILNTGEMAAVQAINEDGNYYVKLRDVEKLGHPVEVGWNGVCPTVRWK